MSWCENINGNTLKHEHQELLTEQQEQFKLQEQSKQEVYLFEHFI